MPLRAAVTRARSAAAELSTVMATSAAAAGLAQDDEAFCGGQNGPVCGINRCSVPGRGASRGLDAVRGC